MTFFVSRCLSAAAVVLCLLAGSAKAAEPIPQERQRLILEMVEASGMLRQIDNMLPAIIAEFEKAFRAGNREDKVDDKTMASIRDIVREEASVSMQKTMTNIVPLFAEFFTDDELRELVKFHKSPIGQKFQSVTPKLFARMIPFIQQMQVELIDRVRMRIQGLKHASPKDKQG
jgi:hypothetical protein